jgi:hypothetical protein
MGVDVPVEGDQPLVTDLALEERAYRIGARRARV